MIQDENVLALINQKHKPLLDIIASYEDGEDVTQALAEWRGFGTTGEAIQKYLVNNVTVTPKKRRSTKKNNGGE